MNSEFVSVPSVDQAPIVPPIADQCCGVPVEWISRSTGLEEPGQKPYVAQASVTIGTAGGSQTSGVLSADPAMAVIVVALVALGVVVMSLYVVQLLIKAKKL